MHKEVKIYRGTIMQETELYEKGEYTVTADLNKVDIDAVCSMLSKSYILGLLA